MARKLFLRWIVSAQLPQHSAPVPFSGRIYPVDMLRQDRIIYPELVSASLKLAKHTQFGANERTFVLKQCTSTRSVLNFSTFGYQVSLFTRTSTLPHT